MIDAFVEAGLVIDKDAKSELKVRPFDLLCFILLSSPMKCLFL